MSGEVAIVIFRYAWQRGAAQKGREQHGGRARFCRQAGGIVVICTVWLERSMPRRGPGGFREGCRRGGRTFDGRGLQAACSAMRADVFALCGSCLSLAAAAGMGWRPNAGRDQQTVDRQTDRRRIHSPSDWPRHWADVGFGAVGGRLGSPATLHRRLQLLSQSDQ